MESEYKAKMPPKREASDSGKLTHLNDRGHARMVDVGDKSITAREAIAEGFVEMNAATLRAIVDAKVPKGEVLAVARVAGIMGAKKCDSLIPLCHSLPLESVSVNFLLPEIGEASTDRVAIQIRATARVTAKTGVEMEALTAVSIAALTIYDMCKAIDKTMLIGGVKVVAKRGGKSAKI
jgi:cyclic pyranopterin phosphate synthase